MNGSASATPAIIDNAHLWEALPCTELNPVRAGMVAEPEIYRWSGAGAQKGGRPEKSASDANQGEFSF